MGLCTNKLGWMGRRILYADFAVAPGPETQMLLGQIRICYDLLTVTRISFPPLRLSRHPLSYCIFVSSNPRLSGDILVLHTEACCLCGPALGQGEPRTRSVCPPLQSPEFLQARLYHCTSGSTQQRQPQAHVGNHYLSVASRARCRAGRSEAGGSHLFKHQECGGGGAKNLNIPGVSRW